MAIGPPTGMRDWLPQDALLRQQLMETIGRVYQLYGYVPIDTPAMENLAVLLGKGGGENEKLLFKILKRGEKLAAAREAGGDLADQGLRFDLTVPLARFVATHHGTLPKVFRRYHMAPVWRADRPQKGRFREFYQCDIDVVGGASPEYEVEILTATERALRALRLGSYRFRLSDTNLLPLLFQGMGVPVEHLGPLMILLDKLDKISLAQVASEFQQSGLAGSQAADPVCRFVSHAHGLSVADRCALFLDALQTIASAQRKTIEAAISTLRQIETAVKGITPASALVFDPLLVRGMDYYTGPIYEAVVDGFPSSILGGGRYDGLIGRFAGKDIPSVGCSIGFERILAILQERQLGQRPPSVSRVLLVNEGHSSALLQQQAEHLRNAGLCIETYLDHDDPGTQFKYAAAAGMVWAIRQFDPTSASVTVRHLPDRRDLTMPLTDFMARLNSTQ